MVIHTQIELINKIQEQKGEYKEKIAKVLTDLISKKKNYVPVLYEGYKLGNVGELQDCLEKVDLHRLASFLAEKLTEAKKSEELIGAISKIFSPYLINALYCLVDPSLFGFITQSDLLAGRFPQK